MKKKRGRPPLPESDRRGRWIKVRATDGEIALLDRLASILGIDRSDAVRRAVRDLARRKGVQDA